MASNLLGNQPTCDGLHLMAMATTSTHTVQGHSGDTRVRHFCLTLLCHTSSSTQHSCGRTCGTLSWDSLKFTKEEASRGKPRQAEASRGKRFKRNSTATFNRLSDAVPIAPFAASRSLRSNAAVQTSRNTARRTARSVSQTRSYQ